MAISVGEAGFRPSWRMSGTKRQQQRSSGRGGSFKHERRACLHSQSPTYVLPDAEKKGRVLVNTNRKNANTAVTTPAPFHLHAFHWSWRGSQCTDTKNRCIELQQQAAPRWFASPVTGNQNGNIGCIRAAPPSCLRVCDAPGVLIL